MNKETTAIIEQLLVPIMKEHGFNCVFFSDYCYFERKDKAQEKSQKIIITEFKVQSYIQFQASTSPTFLHPPIMDMKDIIVKQEKMPKRFLGGWAYKTKDDVKKIIEMFTKSMEIHGFEVMDSILNDPRDIHPKRTDYEEMYYHHEKYVEEFSHKYRYDLSNNEAALMAIQKEIDEFTGYITAENSYTLFPVIAAYGEMFVINGGAWTWYENLHRTMISVPNRNNDIIANPFGTIYSCIQGNKRKQLKEIALMNLRDLKYFLHSQ